MRDLCKLCANSLSPPPADPFGLCQEEALERELGGRRWAEGLGCDTLAMTLRPRSSSWRQRQPSSSPGVPEGGFTVAS